MHWQSAGNNNESVEADLCHTSRQKVCQQKGVQAAGRPAENCHRNQPTRTLEVPAGWFPVGQTFQE